MHLRSDSLKKTLIKLLMTQVENDTEALLTTCWIEVKLIANALIEKKTLTKKDIDDIIYNRPFNEISVPLLKILKNKNGLATLSSVVINIHEEKKAAAKQKVNVTAA